MLLHNIDSGPVLQKLKHPPPPLGMVDPLFSFQFDECVHGAHLCKDLNLSHLETALQQMIYTLIIKYWPVFNDHCIFVLVKNYKCVIYTSNASPIAVRKIMYGTNKLPICVKPWPLSRRLDISAKFTMGDGSLRQSLLQNLIKNMSAISTSSCGGFAPTTFH